MKVKELIENIEKFCPREIQEEWDNSGWQIKTNKEEVQKVLLALEITSKTIDEAIDTKADLIITHHPLFFNGVKCIDNGDVVGGYVFKLIENDIGVYSCHTNFDIVAGGNNDFLGELLGLDKVVPKYPNNSGILRHGFYKEPKVLGELIDSYANALQIDKSFFKLVGDKNKEIKKVAICTGAGAEFIKEAFFDGCDLIVTGDIKYHDARLAEELGIAALDVGHYGSEKIFTQAFHQMLKKNWVNVEIFELSKVSINPFSSI